MDSMRQSECLVIKSITFYSYGQGGKSRDSRGLEMADAFQNPSIRLRLSLIFPLILVRLVWGLKQISRRNKGKVVIF